MHAGRFGTERSDAYLDQYKIVRIEFMKVLVINAGSSSLKYQLIDMKTETLLAKGHCGRIGIDGYLKHKPLVGEKPCYYENIPLPTHDDALKAVVHMLTSPEYGVIESMSEIAAVGHRVLHGGEAFTSSVLVNDEVMQALERCIPLAPLHNPAQITGIHACTHIMGDIPQVAVFDTGFHQTMPPRAFLYAIPYEYYENDQIRRYGFHGTSHRYVTAAAAEMLGRPLESLKLISCHLGNGSSVAAVEYGKCIDTSMGLTPLPGLPMGTRCGDIDSAVLQFLMKKYGYTIDEMLHILNKKSGMLGLSGVSPDFRDLLHAAEEGDTRCRLALDIFTYQAAKVVGSYVAALNGVDAIIFTAGIGENSPQVRAEILSHFGYLGCCVNEEANAQCYGHDHWTDISGPGSAVKLLVIPTNEELVIARDTRDIVHALRRQKKA